MLSEILIHPLVNENTMLINMLNPPQRFQWLC